ncbi:hypothetical protein [Amycolatopsis sp. PS_44_ISF1]|uniref:hypothetical protein n=1 Tax=Amycolatopsis sp. PS_44_ISF1 TaxID=2974917 RepID=UPI0028DF4646|nr:hypothetical protein [Amycolatopsis sp. PS_44_ISF1]MDT8915269.1 hypothetical protein [Amycolatopsis sp. PS_44_ISF1]
MKVVSSVASLFRLTLWVGGLALLAGMALTAAPSSTTGAGPSAADHAVRCR